MPGTVRPVLIYPEPILKQVMAPIQAERIDDVAADLVETMRSFPGCVGIAAPQIGELSRIAVVDVSGHRKAETSNGLLVLANPRLVESEGAETAREGCLSIPDLTANVRRATSIRVAHARGEVRCSGFEARCVLHELDHLDGILFLDRVASLVDDLFRRQGYSGGEASSPGEPAPVAGGEATAAPGSARA
ncbi:MAG: peptide deformylase [Solirubrobacterales bacterium]|nr:peptide deformylase [Solirubrobacterales bacterium]